MNESQPPNSVESNAPETKSTDKPKSTNEPETDKSPETPKPPSTNEPETDNPSSTHEPETQPPNKPETKTVETKPTELDWFFNLIDSIKKGTYDPLKWPEWPEWLKLPTPPQFVFIEMLELAKDMLKIKVKTKVLEYEKLLKQSNSESNLNTNSSG